MTVPRTELPPGPAETEKTGETDRVGNGEFLSAVFGGAIAETRPIVVSFAGNPVSASKSAWFGRPWLDGGTDMPSDSNNYFSLAVFRPDEANKREQGTLREQ